LHPAFDQGNADRKIMTTKTEKAAETNAFSALGEALESAAEKFEEGSTVARESAKNAAQATRKVFAGGMYKTAYWVSYGFVYSTVYLTELLPEESSFRRGLEEGATDAQAKVHGEKTTTKSPVPSPSSAKAKPKARSRSAKKPGAEKAPEADAAATS
jgi:hypothetical protein